MTDPTPERIVLAVDVGSSSIRCAAYRINIITHHVDALEDCCAKREARTVQPNTGRIQLDVPNGHQDHGENNRHITVAQASLLDQIDSCIDDTLKLLRQRSTTTTQCHRPYFIVGVGFSTFVMNLVGVDHDGQVIGEAASMSYACNSPEATEYFQKLKR